MIKHAHFVQFISIILNILNGKFLYKDQKKINFLNGKGFYIGSSYGAKSNIILIQVLVDSKNLTSYMGDICIQELIWETL
jgi:hypothetical protein